MFQDNEEGTVEPGANWIAYDPDAISDAPFGYTPPANFGDPVFFSVVLSNEDGTDTKRETVRIATSNTFGSMTVESFDVSVKVSGTTDVTSGNGVAVVSYGTSADALNDSETFNIAEDGTFSGEVDGLKEGTEYFYAVEIRTGSVPTGSGSGKFRTLEFETYGNCAVVNGSASADGDSAVISFTSNGRIRSAMGRWTPPGRSMSSVRKSTRTWRSPDLATDTGWLPSQTPTNRPAAPVFSQCPVRR